MQGNTHANCTLVCAEASGCRDVMRWFFGSLGWREPSGQGRPDAHDLTPRSSIAVRRNRLRGMGERTSIPFPLFSFPVSPPYTPTPAADYRDHNHRYKPTGKKQVGDSRVRIEQTASPLKNQNAEQIQPAPTNERGHDRTSNCTDGGSQQFHLIGKNKIFFETRKSDHNPGITIFQRVRIPVPNPVSFSPFHRSICPPLALLSASPSRVQ